MRLGIDFGTSSSRAAVVINGALERVKDPLRHGFTFPSSVYVTERGEILVGHAAENQRRRDPSRYRREFKRDLGRQEPYLLGELARRPEELVAEVLKKLKAEADRMVETHDPIGGAVLTVPATYEEHKQVLMTEAGRAAGFDQVITLEEPKAAAFYFGHRGGAQILQDGGVVLVYDLGGGTFDAAVMRKTGEDYQFLAPSVGDPRCGGVDFDRAIFTDLVNRCQELGGALDAAGPGDLAGHRLRANLADFCRDLKHLLSEIEEARDIPPAPPGVCLSEHVLTRSQFNRLIEPFLERTAGPCEQLVREAQLDWSQVDGILMVGGSCRIPFVEDFLKQRFQRPVWRVDDPELAVCQGAALWASQRPHECAIHLQSGTNGESSDSSKPEPRKPTPIDPPPGGDGPRPMVEPPEPRVDIEREFDEALAALNNSGRLDAWMAGKNEPAVTAWRREADQKTPKAQWLLGEKLRHEAETSDTTPAMYDTAPVILVTQGGGEIDATWVTGRPSPDECRRLRRDARQLFQEAAAQGLAAAQWSLGVCFREGVGLSANLSQAAQCFEKASEGDFAAAQADWAELLLSRPEPSDGDREQAVQLMRRAAEGGFVPAMVRLGEAYLHGDGVEQDDHRAFSWLQKAAHEEYPQALFALGRCYAQRRGVERNPENAVQHYRQAAERGCAPAQHALACCLARGEFIAQDLDQAVAWCERAAQQHHAAAQRDLALLFLWRSIEPELRGPEVSWEDPAFFENRALQRLMKRNGDGAFDARVFNWFEAAARQDDPEGVYALGECYAWGLGAKADQGRARELFRRASEHGSVAAARRLGDCWLYGWGGEQDAEMALALYAQAAEAGDRVAQRKAAICQLEGCGVKRDEETALRRLRALAEEGDAEAAWRLAVRLMDDHEPDIDQMVRWMEEAARRRHPDAMWELANRHRNGDGLPVDDSQALLWLQRAAAEDHADAQYELAQMYETGDLVEADPQEALKWRQRAAAQGHPLANDALGKHYLSASHGQQDYARAVAALEVAAGAGILSSQFLLAECYYYGRGCSPDWQAAFPRYEQAAQRGHIEAAAMLGECYALGHGVEQDFDKAAKWYRRAAESGNTAGQRGLATCYAQGEGVPQDDRQAFHWFRKAAEQGDVQSQLETARRLDDGNGCDQDPSQAVIWRRRAAEAGYWPAQLQLAHCYESGLGVLADQKEVERWVRVAAGANDPAATWEAAEFLLRTGDPRLRDVGMELLRRAAARGDVEAGLRLRRFGTFGACAAKPRLSQNVSADDGLVGFFARFTSVATQRKLGAGPAAADLHALDLSPDGK